MRSLDFCGLRFFAPNRGYQAICATKARFAVAALREPIACCFDV
jgi:hypothetical protein